MMEYMLMTIDHSCSPELRQSTLKKGVFEKSFSIMQKTQSSDEYLIQLIPRKQMSMTREIKDCTKKHPLATMSMAHHYNHSLECNSDS